MFPTLCGGLRKGVTLPMGMAAEGALSFASNLLILVAIGEGAGHEGGGACGGGLCVRALEKCGGGQVHCCCCCWHRGIG